jgi:2-polyprenyl-3-methyl-5-hydroxy-6-metoxy-1,4-benzoquinol methylase
MLRRKFSDRPLAVRVHVLGRYLTCPYLRTLHYVTPGARILDVGAGHGVLALLALEAGAASVAAVDPDLRKTLTPFRHERVRFVAGYVDAVVGHFDLVTLYDVLYRVPVGDRAVLFGELRARLRPGGYLVIKELDPEHRLKAAWNRAQEWVSDRFLGITLGEGFYYETSAQILKRLGASGFEDCRAEDIGRGYPHSHVTYTGRVPG